MRVELGFPGYRVFDGRGRRVRPISRKARLGATRGAERPGLGDFVRPPGGPIVRPGPMVVSLGLIGIGLWIFAVGTAVDLGVRPGERLLSFLLSQGAGFVAFHAGVALLLLSTLGRVVQHAMMRWVLGCGACASCGYGLESSTPEADGCTVCPECGAAWRLDRERADAAEG